MCSAAMASYAAIGKKRFTPMRKADAPLPLLFSSLSLSLSLSLTHSHIHTRAAHLVIGDQALGLAIH
jgi:hypothetical protein